MAIRWRMTRVVFVGPCTVSGVGLRCWQANADERHNQLATARCPTFCVVLMQYGMARMVVNAV